jgi:hypothetical protein
VHGVKAMRNDDAAQWMLREWAQVVIIFKVIFFREEEKDVSTHR